MARPQRKWEQNFTFGGRLPWAVGLLLSLVLGLSLIAAFSERHFGSLFKLAALLPDHVWHGQVWRLITWTFFEPTALGLIWTALMIYWFGRDLAAQWGSRRFLGVFGGVVLVAAVGTCLVGLLDPTVLDATYLGSDALGVAMTVTWGFWFPDRTILLFFVLPVKGRWIGWGTIAVTVIFAVFQGWTALLPMLIAELSVVGWLYRRVIFARWKNALDARRRDADRAKARRRSGGAVVEYLRPGDRPGPNDHGPN
jgi:hypothetical protein